MSQPSRLCGSPDTVDDTDRNLRKATALRRVAREQEQDEDVARPRRSAVTFQVQTRRQEVVQGHASKPRLVLGRQLSRRRHRRQAKQDAGLIAPNAHERLKVLEVRAGACQADKADWERGSTPMPPERW